MKEKQEFTPPNGGSGTPIPDAPVISEADRKRYLDTYMPVSQALRDGAEELVAAISTENAKQLDKHRRANKPKAWVTVAKGAAYVVTTLLMAWGIGKVSGRGRSNSVSK